MKAISKVLMTVFVCALLLQAVSCRDTKDSREDSSGKKTGGSSATLSDDFWGDDSSGTGPADDSNAPGASGPGGTASKAQQGGSSAASPRETTDNFVFPKINLTNKTVKIMGVSKTSDQKIINKLKSEYGAAIQDVIVQWGDLPLKLTAAVLSGDSPDAVIYRGDNPDMPSFVIKNLVQDIDKYADLNNAIYKNLKQHYASTAWSGKHYILLSDYSDGPLIYYNTAMFKKYGAEDPWTLYKQGKWDWNAFAKVAVLFEDDVDKDKQQDRFGFALGVPPSTFLYTTGESFGSFDGSGKTITNNIKSANISRAMNFMHDLIFKKNGGLAVMPTADEYFRGGMTAMYFGSADLQLGNTMLEKLAKDKQLGVVPFPKDPQADRLYFYSRLSGYFIPRGAKNPMGAVALNAVQQYFKQDKKQVQARKEELMAKYPEEIIDRLGENWKSGKPVFELTPFIGYDSVWLSFQNQIAWANQVAQDANKVQATLDDIYETEIESPTGPKVVENFEKYGADTTKSIPRYSVNADSDKSSIGIFLDTKSPYQGKYNGRVDYDIKASADPQVTVSRSLNSTWKTNNTLTLWAKGDGGSDQKMTIIIYAGGIPFVKEITLTGAGKVHSIPFSEFKLASWWPEPGAKLNIESISAIGFKFEGVTTSKRSAYIDMVEAVNK